MREAENAGVGSVCNSCFGREPFRVAAAVCRFELILDVAALFCHGLLFCSGDCSPERVRVISIARL